MEKYQKLILVQFTLLTALGISFIFAKDFFYVPIIVGVLNCIVFIFTIKSIGDAINLTKKESKDQYDYRAKELDEHLGVLAKSLEYLELSQKEKFDELTTTIKSIKELEISELSNLKSELCELSEKQNEVFTSKLTELTAVSIEYSKNIETLIYRMGENSNNSTILGSSIDKLMDTINTEMKSLQILIRENSDGHISATENQTIVFKEELAIIGEKLLTLNDDLKEILDNGSNIQIEVLSNIKNETAKLNSDLSNILSTEFDNIKMSTDSNNIIRDDFIKTLQGNIVSIEGTINSSSENIKELLEINFKNLYEKDSAILQEISDKIEFTYLSDSIKESFLELEKILESNNEKYNDLEDVALNTNLFQDKLIDKVEGMDENLTSLTNEINQINGEFQEFKEALDDTLSENDQSVTELKASVENSNNKLESLRDITEISNNNVKDLKEIIEINNNKLENIKDVTEISNGKIDSIKEITEISNDNLENLKVIAENNTEKIEDLNQKVNNDKEEIKELYEVKTKEITESIKDEVVNIKDKLDTVNESFEDMSIIKDKCDSIAQAISDTKKEIVESFNEISSKDFEKFDSKLSDSISELNKLFKEEGKHDSTVIAELVKNNTDTIMGLVTDFNDVVKSIKTPVVTNDIAEIRSNEDTFDISKNISSDDAMTIIEDVTEESNKIIEDKPLLMDPQDEVSIVKDDNGTKYFKGNKIIKYEENDGTVTEFKYKDDQIQRSIIKKHGQLAMQIRFEDGNIIEARHFRKGKLTDHYLYYPSGKLKKSITFDGEEITTVEFDEETQEVIS